MSLLQISLLRSFGYGRSPFSLIHRLPRCLPLSLSLSLAVSPSFEWLTPRVCATGVLFLRRNPKLMVNYIRPATELGLSRARRVFFSLRHAPPRGFTADPVKRKRATSSARTGPGVSVTDMPASLASLAQTRVRMRRFAKETSAQREPFGGRPLSPGEIK